MTIRKAEKEDLPYIYNIYEGARDYMQTHGNPDQWGSTYPPHSLTEEDLANNRLYVITENPIKTTHKTDIRINSDSSNNSSSKPAENNTINNNKAQSPVDTGNEITVQNTKANKQDNKIEAIEAVFVFYVGKEEAYDNIEGSWTYDLEYGVIHRVASSGRIRKITKEIFNFSLTKTAYIRIDTHEDNTTMQAALIRFGFRRCGTIYYTRNNSTTKRIAFDYKG